MDTTATLQEPSSTSSLPYSAYGPAGLGTLTVLIPSWRDLGSPATGSPKELRWQGGTRVPQRPCRNPGRKQLLLPPEPGLRWRGPSAPFLEYTSSWTGCTLQCNHPQISLRLGYRTAFRQHALQSSLEGFRWWICCSLSS